MEQKKMFKIETSDEEIFELTYEQISASNVIKEMFDNIGDNCDDAIPVPIESKIFRFIHSWIKLELNNTVKVENAENTETAENNKIVEIPNVHETVEIITNESNWQCIFFKNISFEDLDKISTACDYLHIDSLLNFCAAKMAEFLNKCSSKEAIRELTGIQSDFTKEEEEEIEKENAFLM